MAAVIKELHQLSEGKKNGLSPHFFVEFLRTRVSEIAANEVQMEINSILSDEKGKDKGEADGSRNDIVLLRSGISFSEGGKSVRIKLSTAEALVARKLHLVTGASFEEDRKQLVDDIAHLEEILASSTSESVAVETLLQAALGGHAGEGKENEEAEEKAKSSSSVEESGDSGVESLYNTLEEQEVTLFSISDRIAQLRMIYEKSKESNEGDEVSALHYVASCLKEMEERVERVSNSAFSKYDNGETPVVANIKDLLEARKRLKQARTVFDAEALKASGRAIDDVDEIVIAEINAGNNISLSEDVIEESSLNALNILSSVSKQIPQLSQAILERNLLNLIKGKGSLAATTAVEILAQDVSDICQHISSFAVSRNGKLDSVDNNKPRDLERSCAKASLESLVARVVKKGVNEDRFVPERINMGLADARSYVKHCEEHFLASVSSAGGGSKDDLNRATQWLKEKSLLLLLSLFRQKDHRNTIIAFVEFDSAAIFFAALAKVKKRDLKIPYEQVVNFFAVHLM